MLTISAAQQAVLDSGVQADHLRVSVKDAGGTWRDLTTYPGFNAVKSVTWRGRIEDPHASCDVELHREFYFLSLSPLMADSALNRGFSPTAPYAALLAVAREIMIEVAITPMDVAPESGDWMVAFHGRIDTIDIAAGYSIQVAARSRITGRLAQQFIKEERVYGFAADGGFGGLPVSLRIWQPQMELIAGQYILPATRATDGVGGESSGYNKFFVVAGTPGDPGGTTGLTEPDWTPSTVTDGTATLTYVSTPTLTGFPIEQILQNILDDHRGIGDDAVTLYTPVSPGWDVTEFLQQRQFTLDGLRALVGQFGWDIRDKWRAGTSQFELTLYEPERNSPSVLHTFSPSDYGEMQKLAVDITEIRNNCRVIVMDASDLWPDGTPRRKVIEKKDDDSIAKYGDLFAEIQEDETGQMDTEAEGERLAEAMRDDCKEPTAVLGVPLKRGFPWVELNDFYAFSPNNLQFSAEQQLAVTSFDHSFAKGKLSSRIETRGKPTIGARVWIERTVHPKNPPKGMPHQLTQYGGTTAMPLVTLTVGGARVQLKRQPNKHELLQEYEIHLSTFPDQPPSEFTLRGVTKSLTFELSDLEPGRAHFVKVVPRFLNASKLVRGQPSPEVTFYAGRAKAGHITEGIALGDYPLNGGFETQFDPNAMPDHWAIELGTLGSDVTVMNDGAGISGARYLRLDGSTSPRVRSAQLPLINDWMPGLREPSAYRATCWVKNAIGNDNSNFLQLRGFVYDYQGNQLGTFPMIPDVFAGNEPDVWIQYEGYFGRLDVDARALAVVFEPVYSTGQHIVDVDEFRITPIGSPWYDVDASQYSAHQQMPDLNLGAGWVNIDPPGSGPGSAVPYSGDECPLQMRQDRAGRWYMRGCIGGGTIGTVIMTAVPDAAWVPPFPARWIVPTDSGPGLLEFLPNGELKLLSGGTTQVDINVSWDVGPFN